MIFVAISKPGFRAIANLKEFLERFIIFCSEPEPESKLNPPSNIWPFTAVVDSAVNQSAFFASVASMSTSNKWFTDAFCVTLPKSCLST